MPYWSSSRVGAVPQGPAATNTPNAKKNSKPRASAAGRKKGITMEDLKKQTALRLAKEQAEKRGANAGLVNSAAATSETSHATSSASASPSQGGETRNQNSPLLASGDLPAGYMSASDASSATVSSLAYPRGGVPVPEPPPSSLPPRQDQSPTAASNGYLANSNSLEYASNNNRAGAVTTTTTPSSRENIDMPKSKLPHGLTVQELKEMTKARLQAAEHNKEAQESSNVAATTVPAPVKGSPDELRAKAHASPVPCNRSAAARSPFEGAHSSDPTNVGRWSQDGRPVAAAVEAWENASVSTAASDFPGSEYSANVSGMALGGDDFIMNSAVAFGRSRSHPTHPSSPFDSGFSSPNHHFSFDSGYGRRRANTEEGPPPPMYMSSAVAYHAEPSSSYYGNRSRAATYSPRGHLGNVHEEYVDEMQGLPAFVVPEQVEPPLSAVRSNYGLPQGVIGSEQQNRVNRQRASSTTSLPVMRPSDEFLCSERFSSPFGILREESSATVTGLADVFGAASSLLTGTSLSGSASSGLGNFDPRGRAATWGEPSTNMFGMGLFGASSSTNVDSAVPPDTLSDDLAYILKLSGAEDGKPPRGPPPPGF